MEKEDGEGDGYGVVLPELGGRQLKYGLKSIIKQEMDTSNWRPTLGGNAGGGGSSMEAGDWRSKLQADSREMILNNIVDTLKMHVPFSGHEGLQELRKIAMRFEEKIYNAATSQSDYLQKISLKMLTMETRPQNPMPDARQSHSAADCVKPSDPGLLSIIKQEMDTSNCGSAIGGDSSMESGDWRSKLQADSRERILNNILDTLKRHIPFSGHEELQKLKKLAVRFEEKIYAASTSLSDYLRKISVKMLMLETRPQNFMPDARQSNSASNCVNPSDPEESMHRKTSKSRKPNHQMKSSVPLPRSYDARLEKAMEGHRKILSTKCVLHDEEQMQQSNMPSPTDLEAFNMGWCNGDDQDKEGAILLPSIMSKAFSENIFVGDGVEGTMNKSADGDEEEPMMNMSAEEMHLNPSSLSTVGHLVPQAEISEDILSFFKDSKKGNDGDVCMEGQRTKKEGAMDTFLRRGEVAAAALENNQKGDQLSSLDGTHTYAGKNDGSLLKYAGPDFLEKNINSDGGPDFFSAAFNGPRQQALSDDGVLKNLESTNINISGGSHAMEISSINPSESDGLAIVNFSVRNSRSQTMSGGGGSEIIVTENGAIPQPKSNSGLPSLLGKPHTGPVTTSSDKGVIKRHKSMPSRSKSETGKDKMDYNKMKRQRVTSSSNAMIVIESDIHGPREKEHFYMTEDLPSDSDFEEQPRTQVNRMKKVKNDDKLMKMVKVKKAKVTKKKEKRFPVGLRTRTSPKTLWETVKMLNENQREAIRDIGLESLLDITIDGIPSKLGYYVVDKLDTHHMNVKLRNGVIPITVYSIHELLGLPIGGLDLDSINPAIGDDDITVSWRKQFTKDRMRPKDVMAVIKQTNDAGVKFKLNFLVIVVNTLAECSRIGCCNIGFLSRIKSVDMISKIDWCKYIYDCVATSKRSWKRDSYLSFYTGPLTYLTLLYVESTECDKVHNEHRKPATKAWTLELLRRRQDVELDEGGLGYAPLRGMSIEGRTSTCEKKEKSPTKLSKEACIQSLDKKIADLNMLRWDVDAELAVAIERFPSDPDFDRIKNKLASIFKNRKWETNKDRNQEVDPPFLASAHTPLALSDNLALVEVTPIEPATIIMPRISSPSSQYWELDLEKGRENKDMLKRKASNTSLDTKKQRTEPSLTDVDLSNAIDLGKMTVSSKDTEAKLEEKANSALAEKEDEVLKLKAANETTNKRVKELEERVEKLESFVCLKTRTQTQIMCQLLAGKDRLKDAGLKDAAVKLDNFLKEVGIEDDLKSDDDDNNGVEDVDSFLS